MGLFNTDLRQKEEVRRWTLWILHCRSRGWYVLRWVSLRCSPWLSWHYINVHFPGTAERIRKERQESRNMLSLRGESIAQVQQPGIFSAFEWPRRLIVWTRHLRNAIKEFDQILVLLSLETDFDGFVMLCRINEDDQFGNLGELEQTLNHYFN